MVDEQRVDDSSIHGFHLRIWVDIIAVALNVLHLVRTG